MTKKEAILVSIICLLILIILVGLVPVLIGTIAIRKQARQAARIVYQGVSRPPRLNPPEIKKTELLLMVNGKIAVLKENGVSYVVLTSNEGNGYILTGQKAQGLKSVPADVEMAVIGAPEPALLKEIQGRKIKRALEVKNFRVKK